MEPETLQPVGLCFVQHQSHNGTVCLTVGQSFLRAVLACAHLLHRLGLRRGLGTATGPGTLEHESIPSLPASATERRPLLPGPQGTRLHTERDGTVRRG